MLNKPRFRGRIVKQRSVKFQLAQRSLTIGYARQNCEHEVKLYASRNVRFIPRLTALIKAGALELQTLNENEIFWPI